ncbi:RNA 2',3'-cyclic phosphodiesterase [Parachitinimonas caeni]|uniref:RNA 2',3'-cyclic phosphodiesterase n=1 Tax=Parachitinimonas caeni TaxID=3031301 RepID=A0ABT7E0F7_9NEIS|nr:RNA 2',3'-cyclic phosphodiesterase [Parachitinimonas caeni]MDK2125790.1 RNA 2',3'-cyclic phosphodiesterase [Parachitinimonas caeni]
MSEVARVFVALWPDAAVKQQLEQVSERLHRQCAGRLTPTDNLHLTLAFLGDTPASRIGELQSVLATFQFQPFLLKLDKLGIWAGNGIGWMAPARIPRELNELADAIRLLLEKHQFFFDIKPFKPHVTLLRRARPGRTAPAVNPVNWPVSRIALVESRLANDKAQYVLLGEYP